MQHERFKINVAAVLGSLFVLVLGRTLRIAYAGRKDPGRGVIYAVWHGGMIVPLFTHRRRRIGILISQHTDGEIASKVARILGYDPVRGSTTKGGARAFRQMLRKARTGRCLAVTPDGPRGPRCVFQPGVIKLAQLTGLPIQPVGIGVERKKVLSSWDKFVIPAPFSRCVFVCGDPIQVNKGDDVSTVTNVAEKELAELSETANSYFLTR